jgi:phosphoglycolate phosphatase-like HAD superfamily hydrolase
MQLFIDFDGTLADVSERHYSVYRKCLDEFGGTPLSKDTYWGMKRKDASWAELLSLSGVDPEAESDFLQHFIQLIESKEMLGKDTLMPDARRFLEETSTYGVLWLVSLRRNREHLLWQLDSLGIRDYFKGVLSGHSDTKEGVLLKKAEEIRKATTVASDDIIIGDTDSEISAASQLGIASYAIDTGIRSTEFLASKHPTHLMHSLTEVVQKIEEQHES